MNYHNLSIWHKFTSFFRFSNFIMIDWCNTFANCLLSKATSHLILVPLYVLQYFLITETSPRSCSCRDFSLMSKSHIFKNLNLRKKADYNFRYFPEKPFQPPKIIFKSHKLIGKMSLSYGHLLKDKRLKFWESHFWESQTFMFWYVEVHHQRRLKSTKTGIYS